MRVSVAIGMWALRAPIILVLVLASIRTVDKFVPCCTNVIPLVYRCWLTPHEACL
jgi:hypothetical protein